MKQSVQIVFVALAVSLALGVIVVIKYGSSAYVESMTSRRNELLSTGMKKSQTIAWKKMKNNPDMDSPVNSMKKLPPQVVDRVKKFVLFVGMGRSGSSILGSILDAHPHVIVSHEYCVFNHFQEFNSSRDSLKETLFNVLFSRSHIDATKRRSFTQGHGHSYTLKVSGLWQGTYENYIEVIGDKCGAQITRPYLENKEVFIKMYKELKESIKMSILFLWPMRNPYDQISTYMYSKYIHSNSLTQERAKRLHKPIDKPELLDIAINTVFTFYDATQELVENVLGEENVLDVHNCDLVDDPRGTISKIFDFLEVRISKDYLDVCAGKIFNSESKSRKLVQWTPEQIKMVENRIKDHKTLSRYAYSFNSES